VDARVLFSSLAEIKQLSFFGKKEEELSHFQRNYLLFFRELGEYYTRFTTHLLQHKKGYQGLIYRHVAETLTACFARQSYKKYIFVGFNALSKVEHLLVEYLRQIGTLDYLVDADSFYVENQGHEAGMFIREIQKDIFDVKSLPITGNYYKEIPKKIHLIGLPQPLTQVKALHELLEELQKENPTLASTAIVPIDESLLLPILHAVDTAKANITMGYPIKQTVLFQLLRDVFIGLENKVKFTLQGQNSQQNRVYYKDLFAFFNNPYIKEILLKKEKTNIADILLKNNKLFYKMDDTSKLLHSLSEEWKTLVMTLFYGENTQICDTIHQLFYRIQEDGKLNEVETETLFLLTQHIDKLKDVLQMLSSYDIASLRFLVETYLSKTALSFESDATEGLQIMGLLETRTLDFENVIMLSVNEGVIPAGKTTKSFIPYDVKRHYGLQTYRGKDAISSYHFYRLLQRANRIYLLYSLDAQNGNAEKSRFLYQLKTELQDFENVEITDEILTYPPLKMAQEKSFVIQKNQEMLSSERLQKFSASSITTYLRCGVLFYFRYILGLDETNLLENADLLQNKDMGTIIHRVLEQLVENGHFRLINNEKLTELVTETICNGEWNLKAEDLLYEKNHLIFQVIVRYIRNYLLLMQKNEEEIFIEKTEEVIEKDFSVPPHNQIVKLKGVVDRIDSRQGMKRIIDYKTGVPKDKALKIKDIPSLFDGEHTEALQLFFYAYLYSLQHKPSAVEAEIIYFRKLTSAHILTIEENTQISDTMLREFEMLLQETLSDILNPEKPFEQTTNKDLCKYCAYRDLCG
jgi:CRISPR/Cas system-associated exonuclease Cas4 (RecB family)